MYYLAEVQETLRVNHNISTVISFGPAMSSNVCEKCMNEKEGYPIWCHRCELERAENVPRSWKRECIITILIAIERIERKLDELVEKLDTAESP